jgi:hypothetical protein
MADRSTRIPLGFAASIIPYPTGRFVRGSFARHFVPGYDRCCPYGTRWQTFRNSILASRFSNMERDQILNTRTGDKSPAYFLVVPSGHRVER